MGKGLAEEVGSAIEEVSGWEWLGKKAVGEKSRIV